MSESISSKRESIVFHVAGYLTLAAAAIFGLSSAPSATIRWIEIVLFVIFGVLQALMPQSEKLPDWVSHLYLAAQGTIVAILLLLQPGWTLFPILYFSLSAQAVLLLSMRAGSVWIVIYSLVVAVTFFIGASPGEAITATMVYGGGYFFFGAFANALVRVDAARQESQALLLELQDAHQQLQEYALRVEELAVVKERNRLAREMHDTLGHRLTVASVQLEGAQRLCAQDPKRAADMVGTVREQIREALGELRSTVATLRTPIEQDLQLENSFKRLVTHFEDATSLTIHTVLPDEIPELPVAHRLALYRTAQEALTNIQKHASAQQVWLFLTLSENAISLLVSDDGKGLSPDSEQAGFGLRGLRERAAQLDGELHLEPRQGGGTQLSFRLPLPQVEPVEEDNLV